jgi:ectoine hydroxylase-related dioxygenase (phytanoyl-CoA dioxygenase family)
LTADQGFRVVSDVLTVIEVTSLRRSLEGMPRSRAGVRNILGHPPVRKVAEDPRLIKLAEEFLGYPAFPFKATLFDKSQASNWLVTWHQDLALPIRTQVQAPGWGPWTAKGGQLHALAPADVLARVAALRIHLDASTTENGPLRVLPGTHQEGRLSSERVAELASKVTSIECLAPAGGVVMMWPLLLHASSKSVADLPRRVLHLEYATERIFAPGIELAVA